MRIVGGSLKGRTIPTGTSLAVRPTTNFAKEALFNILSNKTDLEEAVAIDLYCGSGNISFELISRGVKSLTSVDSNSACIGAMKKSAAFFKVENIRIVKSDSITFLKRFSDIRANLVFADPPYASSDYEELYRLLTNAKVVENGGYFILEHDKKLNFSEKAFFVEERKYGNVHFSIFQFEEDASN